MEAVVLAAGAGARFGGGKLTAPFGDGVLLHGALAAAFAAPVRGVTMVTGADAETVGAVALAFDPGVRLVHAAEHAEGMGASLRTAVAALPDDTDGVFVFLGDMPRIPHGVARQLAQALEQGFAAAAPVFAGQRGHPVLFGASLLPQLRAARGDAGAREALKALGPRLARVEAPDDGVLFDVDLPSDIPPPGEG